MGPDRQFLVDVPPLLFEALAGRAAELVEDRMRHGLACERRWLTVDQAAAYIGAKRQRIYDLRSTGRLSRCSDGRRGLVDRRELDELVTRGR